MIKKLILLISCIFTGLMCVGGVASLVDVLNDVSMQEDKGITIVIFLVMIVMFGVATVLCFKQLRNEKKVPRTKEKSSQAVDSVQVRKEQVSVSTVPMKPPVMTAKVVQQKVPQEVLNAMRAGYTMEQVSNDMRIVSESLEIMEKTSDIDVFLSRYEMAMRSTLTLEQAKKAGMPIALQDDFSQNLISAKNNALSDVLYRSFNKELDSINKLKTVNGKLNRINRYQEYLMGMYEAEIEFIADGAYSDIMWKLAQLKAGFE